MLPYNPGKYHETPDGIPILHTVDHSLTESMLSLSPSSQFMYEPEVMEFAACGQVQGLPGRPALELNSGEGSLKPENIISPAVEGMTFQDYVDPEVLFSPTVDEIVFSDCLPKGQNSTMSTPGMGLIFEDGIKQESSLYGSDKGLVFIDSEKLQEVSATSLDVSYNSDQKVYGSFGSFDMLSNDLSLDDHDRMETLMPSALEVTGLNEEDIRNDWFELDKDIYEMSKDTDILLHDPVFSGGPTLTQLNSRDLDSTCLDYNSLKDLYADTFPLDKLHASMPSTDIDLAKICYKYPVGISGATSTAAAVPKVTTCTVTSFVTSLSTSGAVLPQCPDYTTDELSASQEFCYLGSGIQDTKQKPSVQNQWGSLFATKPAMTQFKTSPCFVPLLRNKSQQMDSLIGTIVVTGGGDVSLVVSGEAARSALQSSDKSDFPEENWEEIEKLLCGQNRQKELTAQNVNSQPSIKLEIQGLFIFQKLLLLSEISSQQIMR